MYLFGIVANQIYWLNQLKQLTQNWDKFWILEIVKESMKTISFRNITIVGKSYYVK